MVERWWSDWFKLKMVAGERRIERVNEADGGKEKRSLTHSLTQSPSIFEIRSKRFKSRESKVESCTEFQL